MRLSRRIRLVISAEQRLPSLIRWVTVILMVEWSPSELVASWQILAAKAVSAKTYFCYPYRLCQRVTNENTNVLIRQYLPKGTDFRKVSDSALRRVAAKLNNRPRKRLGYRTPAQVFLEVNSGPLKSAGAALNA